MRKFTATLLVAALAMPGLAAPAMAAPDYHGQQGHGPQGHSEPHKQAPAPHRFQKGERFDRNRATNYQVVDYRHYHNVKAPPKGYHYVRSGNDMLLVGITSGVIAAVTMNMFH
ncbi:nickel/cobalt transporter regulator [Novosphingobium sp. PhB165]|uniref:RcnB family protein n=1 Tax=Novosphingobium sp. PhB165 TaxID=2485105 RepID=UPI00104A11D2|nr:RcnB family protein [Novosphingobium sp. PhB165]TCM17925.1 nickel/cobalt transporter regulator [Novosphingobium sp. PhB165]